MDLELPLKPRKDEELATGYRPSGLKLPAHEAPSKECALNQSIEAPDGPGESHPRAPTERSVTVSRHSARPISRLFWNSIIHAQWANSEPFPSWLCLAELQYVDCLGELAGFPGAAAELVEDVPGLELRVCPFAECAEFRMGAVGLFLRLGLVPALARDLRPSAALVALIGQGDQAGFSPARRARPRPPRPSSGGPTRAAPRTPRGHRRPGRP